MWQAREIRRAITQDTESPGVPPQENEVAAEHHALAAASLADAERSKVKRTGVKWGIRVAGGLAIAAFGVGQIGGIIDKFKSGVLHEDMQISPGNALSKVTLPNKAILVEGEGMGAAEIQTKPESDLPVVGGLFNHTVANWADKSTTVERTGVVQVGTLRNAVSLQPYELPGTKTGAEKKWGVQAKVNVTRLFSQASMKTARDENGDPKVNTDDDLFAMETADGAAERGVKVADIADSIFQKKCSEQLVHVVPAGVMVHVKDQINATVGLLKAMSGSREQATAAALAKMVRQPIKVSFVKPSPIGEGGLQPASVTDVHLSATATYTRDRLAKSMGKSPDNVRFGQTGACTFTGPAARQYNELLNKSRGIESANPGV